MTGRASARIGVAVGDIVGSYRILDELGGGGMGMVYAAQHVLLGRPAAVKVLRPQFCHLTDLVQRFFNEARATTTIRHPGIVEIFDFGFNDAPGADGNAYIVMELLDGVSLADRLLRDRRLPVATALVLARRIALALAAAHERAVIHRDLKPDNVFLIRDPEGGAIEQIKLLDFGIAKLCEEGAASPHQTSTGVLLGTPCYMSPEQCRGAGGCDHRTDLYALGCVLHELLVGRPPFLAAGAGEIMVAHLHSPPPDPRELDPTIPAPVAALVLRLLAKRPEDRFDSAAAVAAALDRLLDAVLPGRRSAALETVAAEAPSPRPATLRTTGGGASPGRWAILGVVVLASAVAAGTLALQWAIGGGGGEGGEPPGRDAGVAVVVTQTAPTPPPPPDAGPSPSPDAGPPPRPAPRGAKKTRTGKGVAAPTVPATPAPDVFTELGDPVASPDVDTTVAE